VSSGAAVSTDSLTLRLEYTRAQVLALVEASTLRLSRLELGRRVGAADRSTRCRSIRCPRPTFDHPCRCHHSGREAGTRVSAGGGTRARRIRPVSVAPRGVLTACHADWTGVGFDNKFVPSGAKFTQLSLGISFPLFDNGRREFALSQARVNRDVARAIPRTWSAVQHDVTAAYDAYVTTRATADLALQGLAVARESFRVQRTRYSSGATTILDLLDAEVNLSQAEADLVQARYGTRLALAASRPFWARDSLPIRNLSDVVPRPCCSALLAAPAACKKANSAAGGGPGGGGFAMPVEVSAAIRDTVVDAIQATGQIEAVQSVELRPEVEGRIVDILVREGQSVDAGTGLFKVDDTELKAQVARAEADRDLAAAGARAHQAADGAERLVAGRSRESRCTYRGAQASYDLLKTRSIAAWCDRRSPGRRTQAREHRHIRQQPDPAHHVQSVNPATRRLPGAERYADRLRRGQLVSFQGRRAARQELLRRSRVRRSVVELPARTILIQGARAESGGPAPGGDVH